MSVWISVVVKLPEASGLYPAFHPEWGWQQVEYRDGWGFNTIGLCHDLPTHWFDLPDTPEPLEEVKV